MVSAANARFCGLSVGSPAVNHAFAIHQQDVGALHAEFEEQVERGDAGSAGTEADDARVRNVLALQFQRVE